VSSDTDRPVSEMTAQPDRRSDAAAALWARVSWGLVLLLSLGLAPEVSAKPAAERLASLEGRLASAAGRERMVLLNDLAEALDDVDPARQIAMAQEALALARSLADRRQEARALFYSADGQRDRHEIAAAIAGYQQAGRLYALLSDTAMEFSCLKNVGWSHEDAGRYDEALASYERALAFAREKRFAKGEAVALGYIGIIRMEQADYAGALDLFLRALRIHESLGDEEQAAMTDSYVGSVLSELGEHEKALPHFERALADMRKRGDEANVAVVLSEIGLAETYLKRLQPALGRFREALEISTRIDDRMNVGRVLGNMAGTYMDLGDFARARESYDRELATWRALGNESLAAGTLANLGALDLKRRDCAPAQRHLSEALRFAEKTGDKSLRHTSLQDLSQAEECLGNYKVALATLRQAVELKDEIAGIDTKKKLAELEVRFESDKKARQIDLLQKDVEIQRLQLSRARLRTLAILAGFVLLAVLFAFVFRRYLHLLAFWKKRTYVSHYKLERQIGSGGMGIVYEARDLLHRRSAAIKLIREEHASDPAQRRRFLNEGDLVDRLEHPNIVRVYERGEHGQTLYIAMELLPGRSLAELLSSGERLPLVDCLAIMRQTADALAQIHRQGIVHRDLKPENVMLLAGSRPPIAKLLDFGLAQSPSLTRLTESGQIMGTLHQLAPEQITTRESSPASDVYALGAVFYELLTAEKPFLGENPGAVVRAILEQPPIPPAQLRTDVNPRLDALLLRMLDKTPDRRPASETLVAELEAAA
jgi:tetratricopeptide (TPR) repeat protein